MALEMTREYQLRWMDFDRYGRIQPAAVLDIFQDIATLHATTIGIGRDALLAKGVVWVVVRTKMELVRNPEHFQTVTVRTWPHTLTRFSFLRDFTMSDEEGNILVKASQEWVLMNVAARKFASVKDYYQGSNDFCEDRVFPKKARKAPDFDEANRPARLITAAYSDIDVNGHVNNALYANFIVNALNPDPNGVLKTLQIDYRYEVRPEEPITMLTRVEDDRVLIKGVTDDGTTAFASVIELC